MSAATGVYRMQDYNRGTAGYVAYRDDDADAKTPCWSCKTYNRWLFRLRYVVFVLWLVMLLGCGYLAPQYLSNTKDVFDAPKGTPSAIAKDVWHHYFLEPSKLHTMVIIVHSLQGKNLLTDPDALAFCRNIDSTLTNTVNSSTVIYPDAWRMPTGFFEANKSIPILAVEFLSADQETMFWTIQFTSIGTSQSNDMVKMMRGVIGDLDQRPDDFEIGLTGQDAMNMDVAAGTGHDMTHTDVIIIPLCMFILMLYLKSIRLMIIPLLAIALSVVTAFAIMLPIAKNYWHVASFAPAIQMSLTVAMSIDYSLFLLTRYREEILSGRHTRERDAVAATVTHSGEVVLASGLTLAITFASLIVFPMDFLSSIGLGASITILCCVIVNLTLSPAVLLIFPRFFSDFTIPGWIRCFLPSLYKDDVPSHRFGDEGLDDAFVIPPSAVAGVGAMGDLDQELLYEEKEEEEAMYRAERSISSHRSLNAHSTNLDLSRSVRYSNAVGIVPDEDDLSPATARASSSHPRLQSMRQKQLSSFWYKSAVMSTTTWVAILLVLVVVGGAVPFMIACSQITYTIDEAQLLPRGSPSVDGFNMMQDYLNPGLINQYEVLATFDGAVLNNNASGIINDAYMNITAHFVRRVIQQGLVPNTSIVSIVYAAGYYIEDPVEAILLLSPFACEKLPLACAYQYLFDHLTPTGKNSTCSRITLTTPFPPLGAQAQPFVGDLRKLMKEVEEYGQQNFNGAVKLYLTGGATGAVDAISKIWDLFPYVIGITVSIVLLLVGVIFKSFFVPLKLILTLVIPLAYTYGLSVWIFQMNKFDWLGHIFAETHSLYWLVPLMAFSILIGLSLDYDVFLLARVIEYRRLGFSNTASIRKGIYKTGSIITGAGIIMALAFAGLMLSSELALNSFGFMLSFSVLVDVFFIRTMLVPALLHLAGEVNWWPSRMPRQVKGDLDPDADEDEAIAHSADTTNYFR